MIAVELTKEQWELVIRALSKFPFEEVAPVVIQIARQTVESEG